ncbi:MAG: hypothetical protein R3315_04765 [Woeseiaceae bacterium]|nr:hypothetical protein [Woeseiaceae bacterium]
MTVVLWPVTAIGQDVIDRAELARCAALAGEAERLACFESLAAAGDDAADRVDSNAEVREAEPPAPIPVAPSPDPAPERAEPDSRTPTAARSASQANATPEDLGAEHLERFDGRPDSVELTVEEVWKGGNRMLYFRFSNGQIWRQMESDYFHYPRDAAFDVTIRQSFMGDYQMRRTGSARMTRIVRVK